uniref:Uncharacterized protein n=1 Tax=Octopus bimaculoides TaxID=37653 RepID=A0A0L8GMJ9_OCTBM
MNFSVNKIKEQKLGKVLTILTKTIFFPLTFDLKMSFHTFDIFFTSFFIDKIAKNFFVFSWMTINIFTKTFLSLHHSYR